MKRVRFAGLIAMLVSAATASGSAPDPETAKMRAIVIHAYGGPEVMKLEHMARPEPADDEILIRVVAASINPVDVAIRKGYLAKLVGNFPLILGMDASGIVEKIGNKVTKYKAGDPVFAFFTLKGKGAKVFATASTANQEFLRQMGADVAIDYTRTKFENVAMDVDVVLDTVGRDTLERSYGVVKKGGIIVSIVDDPKPAALEAHGIRGVKLRCTPKAGVLEELGKRMEAKKLTPDLSQTFPMTQVVQAQDQIATGHTRGKIVLNIGQDPVHRAL